MIKNKVDPDDAFGDNTGIERRPLLVKDILDIGDKINSTSIDKLCHTAQGLYITGDVLAELAYNSAPQTPGHEWISKDNEPLLNDIMDDLSVLDINYNNPGAWVKLKSDIEHLRQNEQRHQTNKK